MRKLALLVVGACTTTQHRVVTSGQDIYDHASELSATGEAEIAAQDEGRAVPHYKVRSAQPVVLAGERRILGELATECRDSAATGQPSCLLLQHRDEPILLYEGQSRSANTTALGVAGIGVVTAGVVAWGICAGSRCDGSPTVNRATEIAGVASIVVVSGALVYLLVGCVLAHACTR